MYKVAAFLDPRGFCALSANKWASTVEFIKAMCTDEEILSPFKIHEREQAEARVNQGRAVRRRLSAATPQPQLTVEKQALANILCISEQYSKVVPVTAEIGKYLPHVQSKIKKAISSILWYTMQNMAKIFQFFHALPLKYLPLRQPLGRPSVFNSL